MNLGTWKTFFTGLAPGQRQVLNLLPSLPKKSEMGVEVCVFGRMGMGMDVWVWMYGYGCMGMGMDVWVWMYGY